MDARPQFLCTLRPTRLGMVTEGPTPKEADTISRHFAYLSDLAERGIVVLAGRTLEDSDETHGIVIFHADDQDDAARIVNADPAVGEGVMRATIQPFRVAISSH